MIHFSCPSCDSKYQAADNQAGVKRRCAKCGVKVIIPTPPKAQPDNRTVLGRLEPEKLPVLGRLEPPPTRVTQSTRSYIGHCPGCAREIPLAAEHMKQIVQCARCDTLFDPVSGQPIQTQESEPDHEPEWIPRRPGSDFYRQPAGGSGMAVAGMVLGIVALVSSCIPCGWFLAFIPAVCGVIFSSIGLSQAAKTQADKGMAKAGLITSILAIVWPLVLWLVIVPIWLKGTADAIKQGPAPNIQQGPGRK